MSKIGFGAKVSVESAQLYSGRPRNYVGTKLTFFWLS